MKVLRFFYCYCILTLSNDIYFQNCRRRVRELCRRRLSLLCKCVCLLLLPHWLRSPIIACACVRVTSKHHSLVLPYPIDLRCCCCCCSCSCCRRRNSSNSRICCCWLVGQAAAALVGWCCCDGCCSAARWCSARASGNRIISPSSRRLSPNPNSGWGWLASCCDG